MLSVSGRIRLQSLLIDISNQEKQIEVLRQVLAEQADFEPYAAFRRIDRQRKGFVTNVDLWEFIQEHEYPFSKEDCYSFINRYDLDEDGKMSYQEYRNSNLSK